MNTNDTTANPGYLLLFRSKDWDQDLPTDQLQQVMDRFVAWAEGLATTGKAVAGQPLARRGRLVSRQNGRVTVSDGPFAESKEAIGGYLLLKVDTFEEALAIAQTSPGLDFGGTIEVRPALEECPCFKRIRERLAAVAV